MPVDIELHRDWKLIEGNCRNLFLGFENLGIFELGILDV